MSGPSADTTDPRAQRLLIRGTTEAQLGDHEEAISHFEAALERVPRSPVLLQALADAYEAQGDRSTALFYARQAQTQGASRPSFGRRLAEVQRAAGDPAAALRTYQQLLNQFPDFNDAYRARASIQAEMGRTKDAIQSYETYLSRTNSPPIDVYRRLLSLYRETDNADGIETTLRALVDRRPNVYAYQRRLGEYYADEGRPQKALALLAPLGRQLPDDDALRRQVQQLARQTGQTIALSARRAQSDSTRSQKTAPDAPLRRARSMYDEARASSPPDTALLRTAAGLLQEVLDRSPGAEAALSLRAQLYRAWGRPEKAGRAMERLLDLDPRTPSRWVRTAKTYQRAHLHAHAAEVAEEGFLLFPGHVALARTAAFSRLRAGDFAEARSHFQDALSLLGDSTGGGEEAVLHAGLSLANSRLGRPQEADDALRKARILAPDSPRVLRLCARSLAHRDERLDQALSLAEQAVEYAPNSPSAHHVLGQVHVRRSEPEAARRHLRIALDTGTPTATLLERLGDVEKALGNDAAAQTYWQRAADRTPDRSSLREKLTVPANS
ncbi:tetratricopeptide repeat protein [Salinibacter grassmerensis]|uniref:tetratricopeptide repeat protein n=1 Tax=Salinibacter grassmerensis TaxID=3040353 RepID=UPI0021E871D3|nr:tetratricopeptide repeat protein [Salinibacter grassmerensis]